MEPAQAPRCQGSGDVPGASGCTQGVLHGKWRVRGPGSCRGLGDECQEGAERGEQAVL